MATTKWTQNRLTKLFRRYNKKYWDSSLGEWTIIIKTLKGHVGFCADKEREIWIDVAQHMTDLQVRHTLIHEMAHAADKTGSQIAHGYGFWEQIERLLEQGAPLNVSFPEMPGHTFPLSAVPRKFPLCRAAAERLEKARARQIERITRRKKLDVCEISDEEIIERFACEDAALLKWREVLWYVGTENGLIDVEGKPVSKWAERVIKKGYCKHKRLRSWVLAEERVMAKQNAGRKQALDAGKNETKPMREIE